MSRLIPILLVLLPFMASANERVPAWIIRLPDATATVFVAETAASAFHRFDHVGGQLAYRGGDYMSIGSGGTGKQRSGDRRTPLGIYFVTERLDTTRLHEKYGAMAFPLDYPNAWDRRRGRSGAGIWVHGVDPDGGTRPPLDTDGCLALPNDRLAALQNYFKANVTPVLVGKDLAWTDAETLAVTRRQFETAVARWARALEDGDMASWLGAYGADFEHLGMNRDEWASFSLQTIGKRRYATVAVSDLLLLADPAEEGLFLSRFRLETVEADGRRVVTTRRLYWQRAQGGAFAIVAEDAG